MKKTVLILTLIAVPPWILGGKVQLGFSGASQALDRQVMEKIVVNILGKVKEITSSKG